MCVSNSNINKLDLASSNETNYQVEHWKNSELHSTMKSEPQKEPSDNSKNIVDQWWHCPSTLWLLLGLSWQTNWSGQFAFFFFLLQFYIVIDDLNAPTYHTSTSLEVQLLIKHPYT